MKKSKRKHQSIIKRAVNLLTILFVIFSLVVFSLGIYLNIAYPPDRIKQEVAALISMELNNVPVTIESLSFYLFNKLEIRKLTIFSKDTTNLEMAKFVTIDELTFHYRLLSLFDRRIKIHKISIINPMINMMINEDLTTNLDEMVRVDQHAEPAAAKRDSLIIDTPLSFELDAFEFNNFSVNLAYRSSETMIAAFINNFYIHVNDLHVPRGDADKLSSESVFDAKLFIPENSKWMVSYDSTNSDYKLDIKTIVNSNIDVRVNGLQEIETEIDLDFAGVEIQETYHALHTRTMNRGKVAQLAATAKIDVMSENIRVEALQLDVLGQQLLTLSGSIKSFLEKPFIDINFAETSLDLHNFKNSLEPMLPAISNLNISNLGVSGRLVMQASDLVGLLGDKEDDKLNFKTSVVLDSICMTSSELGIEFLNLSGDVKLSGGITASSRTSGSLATRFDMDKVHVQLDDTTDVTVDDIQMTVSSDISDKFYPERLSLIANISQIFGGSASVAAQIDKIDDINGILGEMRFELVDLALEELPNSSITGRVDGSMILDTHQNNLIMTITTDSVYYYAEDDRIVFAPSRANLSANIHIGDDLKSVELDSIKVSANDFLTIDGLAQFSSNQGADIQLIIDPMKIRHQPAYEFIPDYYKEGIHDLTILGETISGFNFNGKIDDELNFHYNLNGRMDLDASIDYKDLKLTIPDIKGLLECVANESTMMVISRVMMDNVTMVGVRSEPLNDILLDLTMSMKDYDRIDIDSCLIAIPDFATDIILNGVINGLDSTQDMNLTGKAQFYSPEERLLFIDDLYLSGELGLELNWQSHMNRALFESSIDVRDFKASYLDKINAVNVNGHLNLIQAIDIDSYTLLEHANSSEIYTSAINYFDYEVLNSYYEASHKKSTITVEKLAFDDYSISDCRLNIMIGKGRIEIPEFRFKIYDGISKGSVYANLGDGNIEMMKYYLKANVSRINSAKLLPMGEITGRSSELSMTMEISGSGLDVSKEINVEGALYVTQIGSKFTDNILIALDPKGTDKSIQDTRKLLNWGYKPRLISCEVKHGYIYPTIHLSKGNIITKLIPLNISGGKIELARIPIVFLLND